MKGDGNITRIAPGKWRIEIWLGTNPLTGKPIRKTRVVNGTKTDAKHKRDEMRRTFEIGLSLDADKITFGDFARDWLKERERTNAVCDHRAIEQRRHILDVSGILGNVPIAKVNAHMLETAFGEVREQKAARRDGKPVTNRTMNDMKATISQVFKKALDHDLIMRNPCDKVNLGKSEQPDRKALSDDEVRRLAQALNDAEVSAYAALGEKETRQSAWGVSEGRCKILGVRDVSHVLAVRLALSTGMRRGEVFGTPWGAIDLGNGSLRVSQSITDKGELKPPKTNAGVRNLSLDFTMVRRLARWKDEQAEYLGMLGIEQTDATPVFCNNVGEWCDLHNFGNWWRKFRLENGFETLRFHELRHTQATILLANGVDVKTVQTRMGHANASVTLNWYGHAIPQKDREAADMLGCIIEEDPENPRLKLVKTA